MSSQESESTLTPTDEEIQAVLAAERKVEFPLIKLDEAPVEPDPARTVADMLVCAAILRQPEIAAAAAREEPWLSCFARRAG